MMSRSVFSVGHKKSGGDSKRYPLIMPLHYRIYGQGVCARDAHTGSGSTVDMSSGFILFEVQGEMPDGILGDLCISWPVSLSELAGLTLRVAGPVVRMAGNRAELKIIHYEFHTRGLSTHIHPG